ncbi:hypothetical protein BDN72DRAFT_378331 [Pluteus cervinus]|uniref:Uncharacterized protein n=1 Tax=Pluteus cervinus TaxID=181527 RepID=A0ACD3B261_9AGAR|nr:hypothetical protein BDN72DRAFT_378331 [Pluteus cervinus]
MEDDMTIPLDGVSTTFARNCFAVAAVALLIYECIITHQDERRYIWKGPPNIYKFIYLFSRYFILVTQIVGLGFMTIVLSRPVQPAVCYSWYRFEAIRLQLILACVEVILALRVYALHDRSPRIGILLLCILCISNTVEMVCAIRSVDKTSFDDTCIFLSSSREAIIQYPAALLFTHTSIFVLTIYKRNIIPRDRWHDVPVLRIITRDGLVAFGIISVISSVVVPYSSFKHPIAHHVLPWLIALPSIGACRMIANTQCLHERPQDPPPSALQTIGPDNTIELSTVVIIESRTSLECIVAPG